MKNNKCIYKIFTICYHFLKIRSESKKNMSVKKSVSMQDIADELGVSKVTISKALNGKDGVGDELKKKIFETAERYGYVLPDYGKRKSRKIGIVMSERFNSGNEGNFYMKMYEELVGGFRQCGYSSVMITPDRKTLRADFQTLSSPGVFDGLIFLGILDGEVCSRLDEISIPKVYVDIYDATHKSDSVVTENFYSMYEMTHYLVSMGHSKLGFVGTVGSTTSITDRYLGYIRSLIEQGIVPNRDWEIPDRDENGYAIPLCIPKELPTAFVCNCDETAFRMVKELKQRGIRVPEDISVVGFDNSIYAELCDLPLTTVAVDVKKIGKIAVKYIKKHIEEPDKKGGEVFRVPGQIICRSSVKKIKKIKRKE